MHGHACAGRLLLQMDLRDEPHQISADSQMHGPRWEDHTPSKDILASDADKRSAVHSEVVEVELWGYAADIRHVKCATLSLDVKLLRERLGGQNLATLINVPRLRINDDRLRTLVNLLVDAIRAPESIDGLGNESDDARVAEQRFERSSQGKGNERQLSDTQLTESMKYLEEKLPARVALETLAAIAGLSQSHYSRAFKASTGLAPYQWQLRARVVRAQALLMTTNCSLETIAEATGFADAVHFGRTFRKVTGATPAAWRSARLT